MNAFLIDDCTVTLTGNDWVTVCAALIQGGSSCLDCRVALDDLEET